MVRLFKAVRLYDPLTVLTGQEGQEGRDRAGQVGTEKDRAGRTGWDWTRAGRDRTG